MWCSSAAISTSGATLRNISFLVLMAFGITVNPGCYTTKNKEGSDKRWQVCPALEATSPLDGFIAGLCLRMYLPVKIAALP